MTHLVHPGDNLMFEFKVVEKIHNDMLPPFTEKRRSIKCCPYPELLSHIFILQKCNNCCEMGKTRKKRTSLARNSTQEDSWYFSTLTWQEIQSS